MARILLDTRDLDGTADTFLSVDGSIAGTLARLPGDGATVMPPAVAAEVAEAVGDAIGNIGHVSQRLLVSAADLRRRSLLAELEEGGPDARLGLGALLRRLGGPLARGGGSWGSPLGGLFDFEHAGGPIAGAMKPGTWKALLGSPSKALTLFEDIHDPIDSFNDIVGHSSIIDLAKLVERYPSVVSAYRWVAPIANNPMFKVAGIVGGVIELKDNAGKAWDGSAGESLVARRFTVAASGAIDAALMYPSLPTAVINGADFLSGHALRADAAAIVGMGAGGVDGAVKGAGDAELKYLSEANDGDWFDYTRHVAGGMASGAAHGASVQLDNWADQVDQGDWGRDLQRISKGENWMIDKTYAPVTHVATGVTHAIGGGVSAGVHAAEGTAHAVGSGVHKLAGLL